MEYVLVRFFDDKWASGTNFLFSILLIHFLSCSRPSHSYAITFISQCVQKQKAYILHKAINVLVFKWKHGQSAKKKPRTKVVFSSPAMCWKWFKCGHLFTVLFILLYARPSPAKFMDNAIKSFSIYGHFTRFFAL